MKKILLITLLAGILIIQTGITTIMASEDESILGSVEGGVFVDGERLDFPDAEPFIRDGRTLVPIRAIAEALGSEVEWNGETRVVGFQKDGDVILLQIGSRMVTVNGEQQQIEVPAEINEERTYVPLRFVSEQLKARVEWDSEIRRINIFTDDEEVTPVFDGEELSYEDSKSLHEKHGDRFDGQIYKGASSIEEEKRIEVANFMRSEYENTAIVVQNAVMQMTNGQYVTLGYAQRNNNGVTEQVEATFTVYDGYHAGEGHADFVGVHVHYLTDWQ